MHYEACGFKANAEFICLAVNSHDALVAALGNAITFFRGGLKSAAFNMNDAQERLEFLRVEKQLSQMEAALAKHKANAT